MEEEDEFGDLYADVLLPVSVTLGPSPSAHPARSENNDGPNAGRVFSVRLSGSDPSKLPSLLRVQPVVPRVQEGDDEDRVLGQATVTEEQTSGRSGEEDGCSFPRDSGGGEAGLPPQKEGGVFGVLKDEEVAGRSVEVPPEELRDHEVGVGVAESGGASVQVTPDIDEGAADSDQEPAIPGLSISVSPVRSGVYDGTERGEEKVLRNEDWDSDSEDDLQIVLNDDNLGLACGNRNIAAGVEDGDDDDEDGEDDLVIVTDHDQQHPHPRNLQGTKEQEWEEELAHQPLDGEEKEKLDGTRGNGEMGASPLVKTGYGSHGYDGKTHSHIKYIRPGAGGLPGAAGGIGDAFGQVRPPHTLGLLTGRGRGRHKSFHSGYGLVLWSNGTSGRTYGSGLDFTLPSHKTIFEMDIDGFEEKPWRLPGVDVSDFFNFGLNEEKWRAFCKQLELLRVETTLQSKIHVYESGRSEQVYDPDLPPELATATGLHHGKTFGEQADLVRQERGTLCVRPQMPVGRAIQVESCFTERLPSIDTRAPRMRDTDVIIEIILQDSVDVCSGALDQQPFESQGKDVGGENENDDKHAGSQHNGHLPPACSDEKRKDMKRKESPGPACFADNNASEGNGVSPLDASTTYLLISKSQASAIAGDHHVAPETARDTQSSASAQCSDDAISSQSVKLQSYDGQKEKLGDTTKAEDVLQISPAVPLETAVEVKLEQRNDEHGDLLALDDDAEIEKKETAVEVKLEQRNDEHGDLLALDDDAEIEKKETAVEAKLEQRNDEHGDLLALDDDAKIEKKETTPSSDLVIDSLVDNHPSHSAKKQTLNSQVEQLAFQDDGDDSRATHSDNSRVESESTKGHLKRLAGSEEEIMQGGRTNQIRELTKHHREEKKSSNTRDGYGQDGKHDTKRRRVTSRGKEDVYISHPHRERDLTRGEALENRKERDGSFGNNRKDVDERRGCDNGICSRNSSKVTVTERKGKYEDLHSRKHIGDGEWKVNHDRDGAPKQRERDHISIRHGSFDDLHHKRKRDEEQPKRKMVAKEDVLHVHKAMEGATHGKREKGNDVKNRREDQISVRDKVENHFTKHRDDDNLRHRGREDRRKLNEEMHTHKRREEEHNIGRSGRALASKSIGGVERVNSVTKNLGLVDYPSKARRQHGEHKRGDHVKEFTHSDHKAHQKIYLHENHSSERGKTLKNERFSSHSNHTLAASNGQHVCRERHRENLKKNKEIKGVETSCLADGNRKREDQRHHLNDKISAKGANEQDFSKTASCLFLKKGDQLIDKSDAQEQHHFPGNQAEVDVASDDDDGNEKARRGRSKLERWTSHKERDYSKSSM